MDNIENVTADVKKRFMFQDKAIENIEAGLIQTRKYDKYDGLIPKKMKVLVGPSGSGKTGIIVSFARGLDIPYYIVSLDETKIKKEGIVKHALSSLLRKSPKANEGIIIFDDIDKIDPNLYEEIYKLIKGTDYKVNVNHQEKTINSSKITIFGSAKETPNFEDTPLKKATTIVNMHELSAQEIKQVLKESTISPIKNLEYNLESKGVSLNYKDEDVTSLAKKAYIYGDPFRFILNKITNYNDKNFADILTDRKKEVNLNEVFDERVKRI